MYKKILLTWWGTLDNGGETAGDLLSVIAISKELCKLGLSHDAATRFPYKGLENPVRWEDIDAVDYDKLVFICGPIIYENDSFCRLLEKFDHCKKIAVGVSGLADTFGDATVNFDKILSRDGFDNHTHNIDLSLNQLPYNSGRFLIKEQKSGKLTLGLCLRGKQREYGKENCLSDKVDEIIDKLKSNSDFDIKIIDTKLSPSQSNPMDIYHQFGGCDLIITTRLHGSLLALAHATPFIAIDQIKGGAKVGKQLSLIDWPYSFSADNIDEGKFIMAINELTSDNFPKQVMEKCRSLAFSKSADSLSKSIELIIST